MSVKPISEDRLDEVLDSEEYYNEDDQSSDGAVASQHLDMSAAGAPPPLVGADTEQILSNDVDIRNQQVELLRGLHMQYLANNNTSNTGSTTVPSNTEKTTKWAVNAYTNWRATRLISRNPDTVADDIPENPAYASITDLNYWLSVFVKECRQRDGREYKHQNLYGLVCGISRHIRKVRPNLNILDDSGMLDFKDTLYKVMRGLQSKQTEKTGGQIDMVSKEQWDYLWNVGYLGSSNSTALFYAVISIFISAFGVTSATQLRATTVKHVMISKDPDTGEMLVTYHPPEQSEYSSTHRNSTSKIIMMYRDRDSNPRSFSKLLTLYFAKLPDDVHDMGMWFRPCEGAEEWYQRHPIGINLLRTTIKSLCTLACFKGNFSNHSLSSSLLDKTHCSVTHLLNKQPITAQFENHVIIQQPIKTDVSNHTISSNNQVIKREFVDEDIPTVIVNSQVSKRARIATSEQVPVLTTINDHVTMLHADNISLPVINNQTTAPTTGVFNNPPHNENRSGPQILINCEKNKENGGSDKHTDRHTDRQTGGGRYENVQVDIPQHIQQCLGLFKDCTIQNVTINIYLGDKDREESRS